MPIFSDDVNIFESYFKKTDNLLDNNIITNIKDLLKKVEDEELQNKILKEIKKLEIILNK